MYAAISGIVFILLSLFALRLLFSKDSYVKYKGTLYAYLSGPEKFILLTLVTGMIACTAAGLSSLRLMVWILLLLLGFVVYKKSFTINLFVVVCMVFLTYLIFTMTWASNLEFSIRVFLKYFYPILVMFFVMTFVKSKDFIFIVMRYMIITAFVLSILLGGFMTHLLGVWKFYVGGLFWPMATLADYLAVMSALSFILWWRTGEKKYLFLIGWFAVSCMLQSVRTGLLSMGIMFMFGMYFRYKLASLPYVIGILLIGLSMILFVPNVKEKMFFDTTKVQTFSDITGALEEGNLNTSARSVMWEHLLDKFYEKDELLGQGLGTVQNYMYNNYVFGGLEVPHNDFVQMLCDIGELGVYLYLAIPIGFMLLNWKYFRYIRNDDLSMIATIAMLSYIAILPAMNFDNIVNYTFPVHSIPYIFIGLFYAHKRILVNEERQKDV